MNCADVSRALREPQLPLQAREHLQNCKSCQDLVSALSSRVVVDPPAPATLRHIAESIASDLRPVRPIAPAGYFFGSFLGIFVSIAALAVYRMGAHAIAVMTPLQTVAILGALLVSTGLLTDSLGQQMVPGSRHRIPPALLPLGIAISLTIVVAVLFRFQQELNLWGNAWACLRVGTPIAVLAAIPFWLMLRRGAVLSPGMTGAAAGLLAGLVGTSVLEIHCPNLDAWHILISHLGVAMVCALAGLIIGTGGGRQGLRFQLPLSTNHKGD